LAFLQEVDVLVVLCVFGAFGGLDLVGGLWLVLIQFLFTFVGCGAARGTVHSHLKL
jgi:hypothetical protein